jgi:hypothetical protein
LLETLQVERDDFWSWHWTFRSARMSKPQPMLGAARVTDLAVNVILLKGAAMQQGLLQILRDFCDHSNALCEHCQFPELVRDWGGRKQF